jgi:hypothetical protein
LRGFTASGFARPAFGCPAAFGLVPVEKKQSRAKLALFWNKGRRIPQPDEFCVGSTRFEEKALPGFKPKTNRQKAALIF